jgi:hypothetical protein
MAPSLVGHSKIYHYAKRNDSGSNGEHLSDH